MEWFNQHRGIAEIIGAVVLAAEQILPVLPVKANSTVQLLINITKSILPKK